MAAVALMTVGVGVLGLLVSYLANLFLPSAPDGGGDLDGLKAELAALNTRLDSLETILSDGAPRRRGGTGTEPS